MQRQVKEKSGQIRRRSSTAGLLCIPLLLFLYAQLFPLGARSALTFSPQQYLERRFAQVELCYESKEFMLFFVAPEQGSGDSGEPYAFVKRLGVWVQDAPYERNKTGTSFGKTATYYYGRFRSAQQAVGQDGVLYTPVRCRYGAVFLFPVPGARDVYDFGEGRSLILQAKARATEQQS